MNALIAAIVGAMIAAPAVAQTVQVRTDQAEFRSLFEELVETNTTVSSGSCTLAAERMAARLVAAGLPSEQARVLVSPEFPKDGNLVATYLGSDKAAKPILLMAHLDVVEARREDWTRDPFVLVEENGNFYGRGVYDDKSLAAIWVDILARYARSNFKPRRTIKLMLTCGEEAGGRFNGARWLARNHRDLIDAEFALNEGGWGKTNGREVSKGGVLVEQAVQMGEKAYQDYLITATNPGGHSSMPVRDNAIYMMSEAMLRLREHQFPIRFNDITRTYFERIG